MISQETWMYSIRIFQDIKNIFSLMLWRYCMELKHFFFFFCLSWQEFQHSWKFLIIFLKRALSTLFFYNNIFTLLHKSSLMNDMIKLWHTAYKIKGKYTTWLLDTCEKQFILSMVNLILELIFSIIYTKEFIQLIY